MYWCSALPVCRLQPAESYNPLSFSSFSWKGVTTPLALVLAKILVGRCRPTEGYSLLFLLGKTFHKFSDWVHEHQSIIKIFCFNETPFHWKKLIHNKHISDNCTQNTITVTIYQIMNPEHCSNNQRYLDHNKIHIRYLNNLKPACICSCVWSNLRIRSLPLLNLCIYVP